MRGSLIIAIALAHLAADSMCNHICFQAPFLRAGGRPQPRPTLQGRCSWTSLLRGGLQGRAVKRDAGRRIDLCAKQQLGVTSPLEMLRLGDGDCALDRIISEANKTVTESYAIMDDTNEGNSPRSASGGTTVKAPNPVHNIWADGGWLLSQRLPALREMINNTFADRDRWAFYSKARQPLYIELLRSPLVDMTMILLPPGTTTLPWRRPTGTVVLCKTLFGECELVQMLGDPHGRIKMREATRSRIEPDKLLTYLGGPPRVLGEASMTEAVCVMEVSLNSRMPMLGESMKGFISDATGYQGAREMLCVTLPPDEARKLFISAEELEERRTAALRRRQQQQQLELSELDRKGDTQELELETLRAGVGGLDVQVSEIVRRAFLTRRLSKGTMEEFGLSHVRGLLLHGPPGCGKTLIARLIAKALHARPPRIVNGPELLDKWVGEAERNVRALFFDAEREWLERGDESALHVIIMDEMDAFARTRGTLSSDTSGVRDSIVNQLLAKIDGVTVMDNVLIIGLTNRKDLIEPAMLRPGRLEVHIEVGRPDETGREEILRIHLSKLRTAGRLESEAWDLVPTLSRNDKTSGFTGAELAGLVRNAASFAFERALQVSPSAESTLVTAGDLERALEEAKEASKSIEWFKQR